MRGDSPKLLKGDYAEQFSRMDKGRAVKIIDAPYASGDVRRGKYPSAAQPAQAVSFGQAVRNEETFRINMERAPGPPLKQPLAINLIHQYISPIVARQSGNFPQSDLGTKCSAWIK